MEGNISTWRWCVDWKDEERRETRDSSELRKEERAPLSAGAEGVEGSVKDENNSLLRKLRTWYSPPPLRRQC